MTDQPCLEVPFDEIEKWEKIQGSCARLYAAAEWGYKKGLKEQHSIALRKLADQVVPQQPAIPEGDLTEQTYRWDERSGIRAHILAIAGELRAQP